jgi:hypothetical protein
MYLFFLFNNFNIRRSTKKKAPNINRVRKALLRTRHEHGNKGPSVISPIYTSGTVRRRQRGEASFI